MFVHEKGLVFGCFDPLHRGHEALFAHCKERCEHLTVCVHSDEYIREWKLREPHQSDRLRIGIVQVCESVDEVVRNDGTFRANWARSLGADIVFLSEEVAPSRMGIPADITVVHMPRTPGVSSTELRQAV